MLRIAIIGCGKIADQHVQAISRVPDCRIESLCDRELLMARQLGERIGVSHCFSDVGELLKTTSPDVVHITTPPQSHYLLARQCLESGSHVYLEKPFTVTAGEAKILLETAETRGLRITAGHNYQFTPEMLEMRLLKEKGFLGGKPVHVESYYSYDLGDASYVGPLLGNRQHWVRQLPGQLLHNVVSHGIARLAEFLDDDLIEINAGAHQSRRLRNLGGEEVLDELRVLIRDKTGTTAFFCFSTQIRPGLSEFRVCGPRNSMVVDQVTGSLIRHRARSYKSYLTFFLPPFVNAIEQLRNGGRNLLNFASRKLYQDSGMTELTYRFYQSIRAGAPLPIPHREILLTARIMDEIFSQIYSGKVPEKEQTEYSVV
jgi:predicted dehydrogenase